MRMIDADALRKQISETYEYEFPTASGGFDEFATKIIPNIINNAITADAVPVVRGEWKLYGNDDDSGMSYWCTACNFQLSEDLFYSGYKNGKWIENGVFKYCPNCGARMEDKPRTAIPKRHRPN